MNDRTRGVIIGMTGFFGGIFVASSVDLPTWPKALLVAGVSAMVSTMVWMFLRPRRPHDPPMQRTRPGRYRELTSWLLGRPLIGLTLAFTMQHLTLFILPFVLLVGCADGRGSGTSAPAAGTLTVGQSWHAVSETARRVGYELRDAAQLQMQPQIDGFYLELPDDRAILAVRDPWTDTVQTLVLFRHWSKGKWSETEASIRSFDLPPAAPRER